MRLPPWQGLHTAITSSPECILTLPWTATDQLVSSWPRMLSAPFDALFDELERQRGTDLPTKDNGPATPATIIGIWGLRNPACAYGEYADGLYSRPQMRVAEGNDSMTKVSKIHPRQEFSRHPRSSGGHDIYVSVEGEYSTIASVSYGAPCGRSTTKEDPHDPMLGSLTSEIGRTVIYRSWASSTCIVRGRRTRSGGSFHLAADVRRKSRRSHYQAPAGMRYLSVCSGIACETVAWHPLGWEPAAFAEIDKHASAVLAHHYPDVPNHGDFTTIKDDEYGPIDLLVGGTPCQSFSVAGTPCVDWMTTVATWPSNFAALLVECAPAGSSGRMSLASFPLLMEGLRAKPFDPIVAALAETRVWRGMGNARRSIRPSGIAPSCRPTATAACVPCRISWRLATTCRGTA